MITMTEPTEIQFNKAKLVIMMIGSLAFVAIGSAFIATPETFSKAVAFARSATMIVLIGFAGIVFFGIAAVVIFLKLISKKPAFVIGGEGIEINSGVTGYVKWSEISGIDTIAIKRSRLILLYLKDPEAYISQKPNSFSRMMANMSYRSYGTPLVVSTNGLKCKFEDLYILLQSRVSG